MGSIRPIIRCVALTIFVAGSTTLGRPASAQAQAGVDERTGEWKGAFDWSNRNPTPGGTQYFSGHLDLTLDEYEGGTLKGSLVGSQTQKLDLTKCPSVALSPVALRPV